MSPNAFHYKAEYSDPEPESVPESEPESVPEPEPADEISEPAPSAPGEAPPSMPAKGDTFFCRGRQWTVARTFGRGNIRIRGL